MEVLVSGGDREESREGSGTTSAGGACSGSGSGHWFHQEIKACFHRSPLFKKDRVILVAWLDKVVIK